MAARQRARTVLTVTLPPEWEQYERELWQQVWRRTEAARSEGRRIVLATGVFDQLHEEHENFLQNARAVGDFLVVGIESDARVRELKGPGRPLQPQEERERALMHVSGVDEVAVLPEAFSQPHQHEALIALLRPHFLAVSSHSPFQEAKRVIVEKYGGKLVVVLQQNPHVSTTLRLAQRTMNGHTNQ